MSTLFRGGHELNAQERFNAISHLLIVAPAIAGTVWLLLHADGDIWKLVAFSVYGTMLTLLFAASAMHHGLTHRGNTTFWHKLDHVSIYLMIAGSYTPFTLVTLRGAWGWSLFGVIWALALAGVMLDIWHRDPKRRIQLLLYLAMGWLVLIAMPPLIRALDAAGLAWLVAGGLSYSIGVIFFVMDERWRYAHNIWHLFVIIGALCHYLAIAGSVA